MRLTATLREVPVGAALTVDQKGPYLLHSVTDYGHDTALRYNLTGYGPTDPTPSPLYASPHEPVIVCEGYYSYWYPHTV